MELIVTDDGSSSIFLPGINETYHSTKGAITESKYVFLEKGLKYFKSQNPDQKIVRILEIGFGTGLNALLTAIEVQGTSDPAHRLKIQFTSIEKYPLGDTMIDQLNYAEMDLHKGAKSLFDKIHKGKWEKHEQINACFDLKKCKVDIHDFIAEGESFDLIYFDAFAPSKQPEMWDKPILKKMYQLLKLGGVIVTYCAQGKFKRDLHGVGFEVEVLEGPPGKMEMTRGVKV